MTEPFDRSVFQAPQIAQMKILIDARVEQLHKQLEGLTVEKKRAHQIRGRIAELRDLLTVFVPKPPPTRKPLEKRDSITGY